MLTHLAAVAVFDAGLRRLGGGARCDVLPAAVGQRGLPPVLAAEALQRGGTVPAQVGLLFICMYACGGGEGWGWEL